MEISAPLLKCTICGKRFNNRSNLNRHVNDIHLNSSIKKICEYCAKEFSDSSGLKRHLKNFHSPNSQKKCYECSKCSYKTIYSANFSRHLNCCSQKEVPAFICSLCDARFRTNRSRKCHEQKVHILKSVSKIRRKCPLCNYESFQRSRNDIYSHFRDIHNIVLKWEKLSFTSKSDFLKWKHELEAQSSSLFTKQRGETRYGKQTQIYQCYRCGNYKNKGNNERRIKLTETCKMGSFCPAVIKTSVMNEKEISVSFLSTHVGHKNDIKCRKYTEEQKKIAKKLEAIKKRHRQSLNLNGYIVVKESDERWHVITSKRSKIFSVTKKDRCSNCLLVCDHCNSCLHEYKCNCVDCSVKENMCRHIHMIVRSKTIDDIQTNRSIDVAVDIENIEPHQDIVLLPEYVILNVPEKTFSESLYEFMNEFNKEIVENVTNMEELEYVKRQLSTIIPSLQAMKQSTLSFVEENVDYLPSNNNITLNENFIFSNENMEGVQLDDVVIGFLQTTPLEVV